MDSTMWATPLRDFLGCDYPIMLAGMGGVARHELAAAVSNAGGFGCLGMVRESPGRIAAEVQAYRQHSTKPFAVNLIPAATETDLLQRQVATCIELQVPFIVLFWDIDRRVVRHLQAHGIRVIHQVGSCEEAHSALEAGVDAIMAQGVEAGGHVRGTTPIADLIHSLSAFCPVPLIAAGSIATGQDILQVMRLGAMGVSCGTAFLATHESNAHEYHKQRIIEGRAEDTQLTRVYWKNWHRAEPVRVLKNALTGQTDPPAQDSDEVIAWQDGQAVYRYSTDSPLKGARGQLELMALYAGASCSRINRLTNAAQRLQTLISEAESTVRQAQRMSEPDSVHLSSSPCLLDHQEAGLNPDYNPHISPHNAKDS